VYILGPFDTEVDSGLLGGTNSDDTTLDPPSDSVGDDVAIGSRSGSQQCNAVRSLERDCCCEDVAVFAMLFAAQSPATRGTLVMSEFMLSYNFKATLGICISKIAEGIMVDEEMSN
jgi:hypothetical protein